MRWLSEELKFLAIVMFLGGAIAGFVTAWVLRPMVDSHIILPHLETISDE
jgi:hypothetical protein